MSNVKLLHGHVLDVLADLPGNSVQCVVTSPPYKNLRDYGVEGQLGMEDTIEEYVNSLVQVFRLVKHVLRDDGTLWLNLGDAWAGSNKGLMADGHAIGGSKQMTNKGTILGKLSKARTGNGLKAKDLMLIPYEVAKALRADGWYLRADIIWDKPNAMPESVLDRPSKSHEHLFLLTKSKKYFYDGIAIAEPTKDGSDIKNRRDVWHINTKSYKDAHFATFPPKLVELAILAGTSAFGCCPNCGAPWKREIIKVGKSLPVEERHGHVGHNGQPPQISGMYWTGPTTMATGNWLPGCKCGLSDVVPCTVLDCFVGSGTSVAVAAELGREAIGIDLKLEYILMARERVNKVQMRLGL